MRPLAMYSVANRSLVVSPITEKFRMTGNCITYYMLSCKSKKIAGIK